MNLIFPRTEDSESTTKRWRLSPEYSGLGTDEPARAARPALRAPAGPALRPRPRAWPCPASRRTRGCAPPRPSLGASRGEGRAGPAPGSLGGAAPRVRRRRGCSHGAPSQTLPSRGAEPGAALETRGECPRRTRRVRRIGVRGGNLAGLAGPETCSCARRGGCAPCCVVVAPGCSCLLLPWARLAP